MAMPVIIGDDMTGCMDAGVQLVKKGYRASVAINSNDIELLASQSDIIVIDTESRNITQENAFAKVYECVSNIHKLEHSLIYKKVDSTLRGNVGSELKAVIQHGKVDLIIFAPALPYNKRSTRNGIHYLGSLELTESDIAKDPFSPIKSSYIPEIIGRQVNFKTAVINLDEVRQGVANLASKLDDLCKKGFRIAVVDADVEEDLTIIARALESCKLKALACGSAGLLAYIMGKKPKEQERANEMRIKNGSPVLVISGSPAKATKLQIENAGNCGVKVLKLDTSMLDWIRYSTVTGKKQALDEPDGWLGEVERIKKDAIRALGCGEDIVIDGAGEGKVQLYEKFKNNPAALRNVSEIIQNALAEIFEYINKDVSLSGVVIVGGDTAFNICSTLHVKGLDIYGEVEPFIPCGLAVGGNLDGMPIVTKAGGFGSGDTILKSIKYMKGELHYEK